jgi:hypothetical protein
MKNLPFQIDSAAGRLTRINYPDPPRLRRIRFLSQLLDQSIVLPGGYRIGLDPIVGLIPWIGDLIGTVCSSYLIYEAARLGIPNRVILRMMGNVFVDAMGGEVPFLGDLFDAVWKSNIRNLRLVEAHYSPALPERSARQVMVSFGLLFALLLMGVIGAAVLAVRFILFLFQF